MIPQICPCNIMYSSVCLQCSNWFSFVAGVIATWEITICTRACSLPGPGPSRKITLSPGPVQLKVIRIEGLVDRGGIELSASEEIPERLVRRPWCILLTDAKDESISQTLSVARMREGTYRHHVAGEVHLDIRYYQT
jgi:hypothetical protein